MLQQKHPGIAEELLHEAQQDVRDRWRQYENLAGTLADDRFAGQRASPR